MKKIITTILSSLACLSASAIQITTENWDDYILQFRVSGLNAAGPDSASASFTDPVYGQSYSVDFARSGFDTFFHVIWDTPGSGQSVDDYFTWTYPVTTLPVGFSGTATIDRSWQEGGSVLVSYHNIFPSDGGGGGGGVGGGGGSVDDAGHALALLGISVIAIAITKRPGKP